MERCVMESAMEAGRELLAKAFVAMQQEWLQQRRNAYTAVRWRQIDQVHGVHSLRRRCGPSVVLEPIVGNATARRP